jgi:hypothetical protein
MRVEIPKTLDDVTLRTYIAYMKAKTDAERIAAYTGVKRKLIEDWTYDAVNKTLELIERSVADCTPIHQSTFRIEGRLFGFIPDMDLLTMREHVDAETWAQEIWKGETVNWSHMPQLMAVLFRPVTAQLGQYYDIEKYSMESAKRYVETLKSMKMSQVQGALVFFSTIARDCVTDTLEDQLTEAMMKERRLT